MSASGTPPSRFADVVAWLAFSIDGVEFLLDQRSMGEIASTVVLDPSGEGNAASVSAMQTSNPLPPIALYTPRDAEEIGVLALDANLQPLETTPATRKFFVTLRVGDVRDAAPQKDETLPARFGIMCDTVAVERPDALLFQPLPAPMHTASSPVQGLAQRRNVTTDAVPVQAFLLDANLVAAHLGLFA